MTQPSNTVIRHVVFFGAKSPENVDKIVEGLSMLKDIPHHSHFEVSKNRNQDSFSNEVDVIVYAEFQTEVDMQAYRAHQIYQDCIKIVKPLRELRIAADF